MISEALRLIRVMHNMRANDLAAELGISCSYLSEIENGKKKPTIDLLNKYGIVLSLRPSDILFFSEELDESDPIDRSKKAMQQAIIKLMQRIEKKYVQDN